MSDTRPLSERVADILATEDCVVTPLLREQQEEIERLKREDDANTRELHDICNALPGVAFMDPPDGGSVTIAEQVRRMYAALLERDAELADRDAQIEMRGNMIRQLEGYIEGFRRDLEAARVDAERYRHIKAVCESGAMERAISGRFEWGYHLTSIGRNPNFDAAIDAARARGEGNADE